MVTTTLVIIVQADPRILVAAIAAIIIGREIAISALREWMAEIGARQLVAVSGFGKLKTIMQMVGLGAMIWHYPFLGIPIHTIGLTSADHRRGPDALVHVRVPESRLAVDGGQQQGFLTEGGQAVLFASGPAFRPVPRRRSGHSSVGRAQPCQG